MWGVCLFKGSDTEERDWGEGWCGGRGVGGEGGEGEGELGAGGECGMGG